MSDFFIDPRTRELTDEAEESRFSTRRRSPTTTIVSQLSSESRSTLSSRIAEVSSRAGRTISQFGQQNQNLQAGMSEVANFGQGLGEYTRYLDDAVRANPYGGSAPLPRPYTPGGEGFDGYFDESEFEDPVRGGTRFFPGDAKAILDAMSPEVITRLQERMESLGFLVGTFPPGAVDDSTADAFADVLRESNRRGTSWGITLGDLEKMQEELGITGGGGAGGGGGRTFRPDPYIAPDYATLAQQVKDRMRSTLGRDPDESEIANLTAELSGWHKELGQAEMAAQRAQFEGTGASTTVQAVDPAARFAEFFEEKYASEIDLVEDKEEADISRQVVDSGAGTISDMSRGGY